MFLRDVIDELRLGELSGANLGENANEGVSPFNYEKLTNYVNSALIAIYTRLPLRIRHVLLEQENTITIYKFNSKFAQTNTTSSEPIKYLNDLTDPFDNSLLKIDEVYNESGIEMVLDDLSNKDSLFRPTMTSLQVPYPVSGKTLEIIYRSAHEKLNYSTNENTLLDQIVDLPVTFLPVIVNYVMYKHRGAMDTPESQQQAMLSMQMFEESIKTLNNYGFVPEDRFTSEKLEKNGWV